MGPKKRTRTQPEGATEPRFVVTLAGLLVFVSQVAILPGAYSPFRLAKMSVLVGGFAILALGVLAHSLWRGKLALRLGWLGGCLAALPIVQALSALWAPSPRVAFATAATSAVIVATTLMLATWSPASHRRVVRWAIAGATLSGMVLLAQITGMKIVTLPGNVGSERLQLTGLAGNPSDLAMACILLLPLLLLPIVDGRRSLRWWLLPSFFALTALTGQSLTAVVALGLLAVGALVFLRQKKAWTVAGVVLCLTIVVVAASPLKDRFESQLNRLRRGNWYGLLSAREDGWTAATAMFLQAPVTGVGSGQFSREFYPARLSWLEKRDAMGRRGELATHFEWTHNDAFQLAAELGLIGISWMALLCYSLARRKDRGSPLVVFGILAWGPFLMLHYPTHLAVGIIPAMLILSRLLRTETEVPLQPQSGLLRIATACTLCAVAVLVVVLEFRALRLDQWRGMAEEGLTAAEGAPAQKRALLLRAVESQSLAKIPRHPGAAPWLWRLAGRARLLAGAYPEAESAFRSAGALAPHEEAEMGLGLALAGQGRNTEAIHHLARACRLNPKLTLLIRQDALRSAVQQRLKVNDRGIPLRRNKS
jgi:O-antigen ligase